MTKPSAPPRGPPPALLKAVPIIVVPQATNAQDRALVEACQRGVSSPAFVPGPYCPVNEAGVIDFLDWYESLVRRRLSVCGE